MLNVSKTNLMIFNNYGNKILEIMHKTIALDTYERVCEMEKKCIKHMSRITIQRNARLLLQNETNVHEVLQNEHSYLIVYTAFIEDNHGWRLKSKRYKSNKMKSICWCEVNRIMEEYKEYSSEYLRAILT